MADLPISIFISYAHSDSAFVDRLEADLRSQGLSSWVDRHGLAGGQKWRRGLQDAIDHAQVLLVVLSPEAVASEYVQAEYGYAIDEGKTVIPLYYRACKIPLELRAIQWIDFQHSYEQGLSALLQVLQGLGKSLTEHPIQGESQTQASSEQLHSGSAGPAPGLNEVKLKGFATPLQPLTQETGPSSLASTTNSATAVLSRVVKPEPLWNVPATFTPLIGREQDVIRIEGLLKMPEVRLLTLIGIGGIGKTRLALQVATEMRLDFDDGVCFVGLGSTSDATLIPSVIAEALGVQQLRGLSLFEQVKLFLRDKQLLLILDNFEQVVEAATLVEDLLSASPSLKILVTSRAVLHLEAEHEYPVAPLALPNLNQSSSLEELMQSAAVALFVQRAQMILPTFQITPSNAQAIAEICTRLDGLPLAIELAAARVKLLPPPALLARLSQGLEVLAGGTRKLPARQQTLRSTLKWSYDLLDAQEQRLFRRVSVLVGGWTLEAAEAVGKEDQETGDALPILDGIASLLDESLLLQADQEEVEPRFRMLATVREYGLECLRESGEEVRIHHEHANYFLKLAEEAEPLLKGPQQLVWLQRLDREQENLRAALGWLIEQKEAEMALRFCVALWWFWQIRGYWSEGRRWLKAVLAMPGAGERTTLRAKALSVAGELAGLQGDVQEAHLLLSESVSLYRELGDNAGLVVPLSALGWVSLRQGDPTSAEPLMEESITLSRKFGRNWELSRVLFWSGYNAWLRENLAQATTLMQESLTLARGLGDKTLIARDLNSLGYITWLQGDLAQATILTQESLALFRELGDKAFILTTLETLGSIALSRKDLPQAISCFSEGLALAKELGNESLIGWHLMGLAKVAFTESQSLRAARLFGATEARFDVNKELDPNQRSNYEQMIESLRTQLSEQDFTRAWAEGRSMTLEQVLAVPGRCS